MGSSDGLHFSAPGNPFVLPVAGLETRPSFCFARSHQIEAAVKNYLSALDFQPSVVMRSDGPGSDQSDGAHGPGYVGSYLLWNIESQPRGSALRIIRTDARRSPYEWA